MGFDWEEREQVWDKVKEENTGISGRGGPHGQAESGEEFGDVMFSLINAARLYKINPDNALEHTNQKFIRRFNYVRHTASGGKNLPRYDTGRDGQTVGKRPKHWRIKNRSSVWVKRR